MQALRILTNCFASGQPLEAGKVYAVPAQVDTADADALVRMGRALETNPPAEQPLERTSKPARKKRNANP